MKCPTCDEEMRTVEVEYSSSPEIYLLDKKTGRYVYTIQEEDEPDDESYSLCCGECGAELEGHILDTFTNLIQTW